MKPQSLRHGDTIGVVATASPLSEEDLRRGVAEIEGRNYPVVVAPHVLNRHPDNDYLAGADADRAADLMAMLTREDIRAVFCARGGYGSARLLPLLDWNVLRALPPKIFLGYSDITALHTAFARRLRWVTFHAPMVTKAAELDDESAALFWHLLEEAEPPGVLPADPETMTTIAPGTAEGELTGGCLTLLAHACGTPDAPDFSDKIVLLEDVGESVYRADRALIQLRNAGLLDRAAGFVVGHLTGWREQEKPETLCSPEAVWREILAPLGKPVLSGFPFGHEPNPLSLPLGVRARLDADARTLTLLEAAVSP